MKLPLFVARRATRWWSQPVRFTASAVAALRDSAAAHERRGRAWLTQTPVGIRAAFINPQA
jgi:hypothetical protein